jgi:hypothetical protein
MGDGAACDAASGEYLEGNLRGDMSGGIIRAREKGL